MFFISLGPPNMIGHITLTLHGAEATDCIDLCNQHTASSRKALGSVKIINKYCYSLFVYYVLQKTVLQNMMQPEPNS